MMTYFSTLVGTGIPGDSIKNIVSANASDLETEFEWFKEVLIKRSELAGTSTDICNELKKLSPPEPGLENGSNYSRLIRRYKLEFEERIALVMAMAPYIYPKLLDIFINKERAVTGWGGKITPDHQYFLPTGETLMFTLAGRDLKKRFELHRLFDQSHVFHTENILRLENHGPEEPMMSGIISIQKEFIDTMIYGITRKPDFGPSFPAKLLTTEMEWDDLVVSPATMAGIREIESWIAHNSQLMQDWEMKRKLKPGYKALFHGPPGTGKTLAATLIGKKAGRDIFRIDLSTIVSKYIGETEKNLGKLFDRAEHKDWILFFDEADALFGKRTNVQDSHDRYANQETAYLLQRIEDYNGLVVLASNHKQNIDSAFMRRFQSIVYFPVPQHEERFQLWKKGFSSKAQLDRGIDLVQIAKQYELSGGSIMNIIQYGSLNALSRGSNLIMYTDLLEGLKRELNKENRTI